MNYDTLPTDETINLTIANLKERNIEGMVVKSKAEALEKLKELIPGGSSVNSGASRTLEEVGFINYLKSGEHPWRNLKQAVVDEKDPEKQEELRKHSVFSDYYLGSVHALSQTGEIVIASNTGSQLPGIVYTSPNVIFVVGAQKITLDLADALKRLREHVVPLEDARMKSTGAAGTILSKILIIEKEPPFMKRNVRVIIVKEKLGF